MFALKKTPCKRNWSSDDVPLLLVVDQRGALALADLMMGGEGKDLPDEASELYWNAAQEGLSQVVGSAFTSLSGLVGGRRLMPEKTTSTLGEDNWRPFSHLGDDDNVWFSASNVDIEGLQPFSLKIAIPEESAKSIAEVIHQIMGEEVSGGPAQSASPAQTASRTPNRSAEPAPGARGASSPPPPPPRGAQRPAPVVDVHPAEFTPLVAKGSTAGSSKIDLIADIPVRVTVELGKTRVRRWTFSSMESSSQRVKLSSSTKTSA